MIAVAVTTRLAPAAYLLRPALLPVRTPVTTGMV
jgi:hypothetical protein